MGLAGIMVGILSQYNDLDAIIGRFPKGAEQIRLGWINDFSGPFFFRKKMQNGLKIGLTFFLAQNVSPGRLYGVGHDMLGTKHRAASSHNPDDEERCCAFALPGIPVYKPWR